MGIAEITREGVEKAIAEFDELGRDKFLQKYGFGKATQWFLEHGGKLYDSKAIYGVAYGYSGVDREPLKRDQFSQEKLIRRRLERLGFTVTNRQPSSRPRQYFALLGNPKHYRIEEAVHEVTVDAWPTGGKNIQLGDRVIIWKAKGDGEERGIVAFGQVVSEPEIKTATDNPYWIDPASGSEPKERVDVRYEVTEGLPLWLGGAHDDVLESLSVCRAHGGTVFNVSPEQWSAVVEATGGDKPPALSQPSDGAEATKKWTTDELRLVVDGYLEILRRLQGGEKVVKKRYYADLASKVGRTESSIERRMQNISHVLNLQGRRWITGLVPLAHVGVKVIEQIEILLAEQEGLSNQGVATFSAKVAAARKRGVGEKPKGNKTPKVTTGSSGSYVRDHEVVAYVLELAQGRCEFCGNLGPFEKSIDERYLEVHHARRLADGGPDIVENAVALCPNCHRGLHHARDRVDRTEKLYEKVKRLEP
jgi:5-methylcytosine-specific restriction protein A